MIDFLTHAQEQTESHEMTLNVFVYPSKVPTLQMGSRNIASSPTSQEKRKHNQSVYQGLSVGG